MLSGSYCFLGMLLGMAGLFGGDEAVDKNANENPGNIELTTEQVVVFKDGYCLVVKDGVAKTDENGFAHTYEVPDAAVLGSFWEIPETGEIKSMIAGWDEIKNEEVKEINCTTVYSILKANIGRECRFIIGDQQFDGTILKLLSNPVDTAEANRTRAQLATAALVSSRVVLNEQPATHFLLRSETCLLYTSPSPRDRTRSRMPSSA